MLNWIATSKSKFAEFLRKIGREVKNEKDTDGIKIDKRTAREDQEDC